LYSEALRICLGKARHVSATSSVERLISPEEFDIIIDSGATAHMVPFRECFIDYKATPNRYVILADSKKSPCLGQGSVRLTMGGVTVLIKDVLHVRALRCPLYSVRCHRRSIGCAFLADNEGIYLTFPKFIIPVDDSVDCIVKGKFAYPDSTLYFDARLAGTVSAVSDSTRHRNNRRPVVQPIPTQSPTIDSTLAHCQVTNENLPDGSPCSSVGNNIELDSTTSFSMPVVNEDLNAPDPIVMVMDELGLNAAEFSGSKLSPVQIQQIIQACIKDLTANGCISMKLVNLLRAAHFPSKTPTSTTPDDRPELLSSDKMPSSAGAHRRFTVPQLHRYFGFRQLKNWETVLAVAQDNISLGINCGKNSFRAW
jgi:hypothetical protein